MAPRMNINSPVGHLTMAGRFEQAIITLGGGSTFSALCLRRGYCRAWPSLLQGNAGGYWKSLVFAVFLTVFTELEGDHT